MINVIKLTKKDQKKHDAKSARMERQEARLYEKAYAKKKRKREREERRIENILARHEAQKKAMEQKKQNPPKVILTHEQKIQKNRDSKALARLFGIIPPLKKRPKKSFDEFKGYAYDRINNTYRVQFKFKGKNYRLGRYNTPEEAHAVYVAERTRIQKEYEFSLQSPPPVK
jgi:hypothetical protein